MKIFCLNIALFCTVFLGYGQQFNFGITAGCNIFQHIRWDRSIYSPENSFHTYIEDGEGRGLLRKNSAFNGLNYGGLINATYKRFSFNLEPQFYYQKTYLTFERPFFVERNIGKRAFRMPTFVTARFFKGPKSPFILIGLNLIKEKNWDFQNPGFNYYFGDFPEFEQQFQTGDNHFEGALYDNRWYFNYIIGIGKTGEKWTSSIRFQRKLDITSHEMEAGIWQLELSFSFKILSSKDFTRKHFLYEK